MQKELIIGLALLGLTACGKVEKKSVSTPPVRVRTMVVASEGSHPQSRYVGVVEALREIPLSMQSSGQVLSVYCQEGERVKKGQVLVRIDSTQAVNALQAAEATLREIEDGYARLKQVYSKGAVTDQKMVETESRLTQANALFAAAKKRLSECTLVAPCDGLIQGLNLEVGQVVVPGVRLFTILDTSAFQVRFTVPEAEIGKIGTSSGKTGEMDCAAVNATYRVIVTEKSHKANALTHTYEVAARVQGATEGLMPGMVAKVKMQQKGTEPVIVIPAQCVLLKPEAMTVWVIEQGKAVRKNITVAGYQADGVQVESGLEPGDTLIVDGYQKLYQACAVESL